MELELLDLVNCARQYESLSLGPTFPDRGSSLLWGVSAWMLHMTGFAAGTLRQPWGDRTQEFTSTQAAPHSDQCRGLKAQLLCLELTVESLTQKP